MFVKLQTSLAGVNGSHPYGATIEMEDAEAQRYCEAGLAVEATEEEVAKAQQPAASETAPETSDTDLTKMTKAQIVAHAAEVHGLELDPSQKKAGLIAAIADKAETPSS